MGKLPAFLLDHSEVAYHAVLERGGVGGLNVTPIAVLSIFFLGHKAFSYMPQAPILMLNASMHGTWEKVAKSFALHRFPEPLDCLFHSTSDHKKEIVVSGHFLPSSTSADTGFNRNMEVLQCAVPWTIMSSESHAFRKEDVVHVSLLRRNLTLLSFSLSLRKRQATGGYGLGLSRRTSAWDAWEDKRRPSIYLAVAVVRPLEPSRPDVSLMTLVQFVQHNVNIGFDHQFIGVFLDARSNEFTRLLLVLRPYIQNKQVSITPLSRGVDDTSGTLGLIFIDDYTRFLYHNQVLSISRGMASHVVFIHASEFIAFSPRIDSIQQLLVSLPEPLSRKNNGYPSYYKFLTFGVADPPGTLRKGPGDSLFISDYYQGVPPFGPLPAFNVAIVPTAVCLLIGWHEAAACGKLDVGRKQFMFRPAVTDDDVYFVAQTDAQVYFFRQANFDPWQLVRQHYLPSAQNFSSKNFAQRCQDALIRSGVLVQSAAGLQFPALAAATLVGPKPFPRGQQYLREKGFIECQHSKGCAFFGAVFGLKREK